MTRALLLCLTLTGCMPAKAVDFYVNAAIGKSELKHPGSNKWWLQQGWDHTLDEGSNAYTLGVGAKFSRYLSMELNYHNLGEYHQFAGFMANESIYSETSPTHCNGPCEPTQWGYLDGYASAVSVSVLPRYPVTPSWSVYARLGLAYYQAVYSARVTSLDPMSRSWSDFSFRESGWSTLHGVGVSYKRLSLEWNALPYVKVSGGDNCCGPYTSASTLMLSYRMDIE